MDVTIECRIAELAARQHCVVTRRQLVAAGATSKAIGHRLRARWFRPVHRGVYLVGPVEPAGAREMAAVLACGAGARISHASAAWLLGIGPQPRDGAPVDVSVPASRVVRRAGIRVHRVAGLDAGDVVVVDGIPVTDPARTLLDLAGKVGRRDLERAMARAEQLRLIRRETLAALVAHNRRRPGAATLAAMLASDEEPAFVRSEFEDRFVDAVREYGLPTPRYNFRIGGFELDCYWPDARLAVELDGQAYHTSWKSQQNDRRRDGDLAAADIHVIRVTWDQLVRETGRTMVRIAQALAVRRVRLRDAREG